MKEFEMGKHLPDFLEIDDEKIMEVLSFL